METGGIIGISLLGTILGAIVIGLVWFGIVKFNEPPPSYSPGFVRNRKNRKSTRRTRTRKAEA